MHAELIGASGIQAEYARVPLADGTLVETPQVPNDDFVPSLLAASDVLGTSWFAADAAEAGPGKIVAVVGDGAVGLLGVLAATQLGAHSVIEAVGRQGSMMQAIRATHPGVHVGYVGVSHNVQLPGEELFFSGVHLHGGPAPVRRFLPDLIDRVLRRQIDPSKIFDLQLLLE